MSLSRQRLQVHPAGALTALHGAQAVAVSVAQDANQPGVTCPSLPSSETAYQVVRGEGMGFVKLVRDLTVRAGLIGVGMFVAGEREHLIRNSLAGSAGIEVFVLGWVWLRNGKDAR